jgi:RNA polymerase sigma-70 factor (ECF subfamily)
LTDDDATATLSRIAAQDRAAFRALYGAVAPKLLGILLRMLRDRAEAEDALQEVFTRIWLNARKFDPAKGRAMTWLATIARNHAIDRLRARPEARGARLESGPRPGPDGDGPDIVDTLPDTRPGAEAQLSARGEMGRVVACFGELPSDRAAAVRGAYLDGLSYADLAARHNVPLNTMRTWLRRALIALRECLER